MRLFSAPLPALTALIALLILPLSADATVMRYADLDRLVETSDIVVHATIVETTTRPDEDDVLWTHITAEVHENFMGLVAQNKDTKTVLFEQWGGEFEDRRALIPGDARLSAGQEVILFLSLHEESQKLTLTALSQAVFEIHEDANGTRRAQRDVDELSFFIPGKTDRPIAHHHEPPHDLAQFKDILRAIIASHEDSQ